MPASWIRASVLDDLVLDGHEQIAASLLFDDRPFAFLLLLLTDKERPIQLQRNTRQYLTLIALLLAVGVVDGGNEYSSSSEDK